MKEVRARDGRAIARAPRGDETIHDLADHILRLPDAPELQQPLLSVAPLALLAHYLAARKDHDVDQPGSLAKAVTVQ